MPWKTEPSLPEPRTGLAAATCDAPSSGSGYRIYAIGGSDGSSVAATATAYDTSAKKWSPIRPMPTARAYLAATSGPGRLYALGGWDGSTALDTHEIYDPAADTWSPAAPVPTPRMVLATVTGRDGLIYALGGNYGGKLTGTVEAYDPATDAWTPKKPMPTPRNGLAAVTGPDGLIYAIGGGAEPGRVVNTVEVFDPTTNSWTTGPSLPAANWGLAAAVGPDELIYAIGGSTFSAAVATMYSYDAKTPAQGWAQQAPLLTPQALLAASTGPDGLIYAIGGSTTTQVLNTVEAFTVATTQTAPNPYIGNGTYQSPDIILLDPNGNPVPLNFTGPPTWRPSLQYGIQAIVYNDSTVNAVGTTVGFWQFSGGAGSAGTLIDKTTVTVPANGSLLATSSKPFSVAGPEGEYVAVSIANPKSPYFNVDPASAAQLADPSVAEPPGSDHYGSAWRARPQPCLYLFAELQDLSPGDFNNPQEYEQARRYFIAQIRHCLAQYG